MPALADIDRGTLTPEKAAALETLYVESEVLAELNEAQAESIGHLEHLVSELQRVVYGVRQSRRVTPLNSIKSKC